MMSSWNSCERHILLGLLEEFLQLLHINHSCYSQKSVTMRSDTKIHLTAINTHKMLDVYCVANLIFLFTFDVFRGNIEIHFKYVY